MSRILTVGHIPPTHQLTVSESITIENVTDPVANLTFSETGPSDYALVEVDNLIVLLPGKNATAREQSIKTRLDVSRRAPGHIMQFLAHE
jgi:hypothetical protein